MNQSNKSGLNALNEIINNLINSQEGHEAMNQFNEQMSELAKSFADSQTKLASTNEDECCDCDCNERGIIYNLTISHQLAILDTIPFGKLSRNDTQTLLELEKLRKSIIDGAD